MKKNKVWAVIGAIAMILLLLFWLWSAFLTGDTDVNANDIPEFIAPLSFLF